LHHAAPLINQLYHILCHCQTLWLIILFF